jgi:hypothetical protein
LEDFEMGDISLCFTQGGGQDPQRFGHNFGACCIVFAFLMFDVGPFGMARKRSSKESSGGWGDDGGGDGVQALPHHSVQHTKYIDANGES